MRTGEGSGSGAAAPRLHRPQAEPGAGRPPQRSSPDLPRLLGTESRLAETRFIQLKVTKQGKLSSPFPLFFFFFFPLGQDLSIPPHPTASGAPTLVEPRHALAASPEQLGNGQHWVPAGSRHGWGSSGGAGGQMLSGTRDESRHGLTRNGCQSVLSQQDLEVSARNRAPATPACEQPLRHKA